MSFRSWLSDKIKPKLSTVKEEIEHGRWTSSRLWVLVAFAALLVWLTKGVLTEENLKMVFWLCVAFLMANTVSKCVTLVVNAWVKVRLVQTFSKDGIITPEEEEVIDTPVPGSNENGNVLKGGIKG